MKNHFLLFAIVTIFFACEKDKENPAGALYNFTSGTFVLNEGSFGTGNSSVSHVTDNGIVTNNIFLNANLRLLGDVAQSITKIDDKIFIVVNNSQKVEVVDATTFETIGVITTSISQPRYVEQVSPTTAYISDWASGIVVVDINTLTVLGTIAVGTGAEDIIVSNGKAFVANSGAWADDSTLSVIDISTHAVVDTIQVGDKPFFFEKDSNGKLWVLCAGKFGDYFTPATQTESYLYRIDPTTHIKEDSIVLGTLGEHTLKLSINTSKDELFVLHSANFFSGNIYKIPIGTTTFPGAPFVTKQFYGLGVDEVNNVLYGGIGDFSQNTYTFRYNGNNGNLIDSLRVGVAPNNFERR